MIFFKKVENFWYYYKWYLLAGLFFLGASVYFTMDASKNLSPDLTVCYIGNHASQLGAEDVLNERLSPLLMDANEDGVKHIEWIELTLDNPDDLQKKSTIEAQIPALVAAGECKLFIVSETYADSLKELGVFDGELISIEGSSAFADSGIDTVGMKAGVRVPPLKDSAFHQYTLKNATTIYEMIKNEKKG